MTTGLILIILIPQVFFAAALIMLSWHEGNSGAEAMVFLDDEYDVSVSGSGEAVHIKALDLFVAVTIIMFLATFGVGIWIYKSISDPINKLKKAARNIRDGNLDFCLEAEEGDEFAELFQDFEDMRRRLKESAEEKLVLDKENRELISNISHDLKTPLSAVKGYVEGIMDGVADTPEKMDRYLKTIYNKADEMDHLINELTVYAKIDTNRILYHFTVLAVDEFFNKAADELRLEMQNAGIEFLYANYVNNNVRVIADGEQIRRVIHNIVGNSIKYMDKPSKVIQLRVRDVGDFIQVEVEDNGKGIASRDIAFIFDRFYRTDASRNSSEGGSGIGLSIVKKIMEDHGGKAWATSRLGIGTIMYFVLRKESVQKERLQKERLQKESVSKESVPKESVPKESVPKESAPKESLPKESLPKEKLQKEKLQKEKLQKENRTENVH